MEQWARWPGRPAGLKFSTENRGRGVTQTLSACNQPQSSLRVNATVLAQESFTGLLQQRVKLIGGKGLTAGLFA